jgi:hypothetical protein
MIRSIRCLAISAFGRGWRKVGTMPLVAFFWSLATSAMLFGQQPDVHYLHQGIMPPGAIGSQQLLRGGPVPGFFQPVEIKCPAGVKISLAVENQFDAPQLESRKAGFLIGAVYRLRVTNIRLAEGAEVFPTVEVVDRLYSPVGQERRFAIPIEIAEEDLKLAIGGKFVTRVIYLEDPRQALPAQSNPPAQSWFDVKPGQDPLAVADGLGRPVAILRMGARLPAHGAEPSFFFGSPPFASDPSEQAAAANESVHVKKPAATKKPTFAKKLAPTKQQPSAPKVQILPPPPKATAAI